MTCINSCQSEKVTVTNTIANISMKKTNASSKEKQKTTSKFVKLKIWKPEYKTSCWT